MLRILIYVRRDRIAALLEGILDTIDADVDTTLHVPTMLRLNKSQTYDYIISDDIEYFSSDAQRIKALRRGNRRQPRIYVIGGEREVIRCCKLLANGIDQYISLPIHPMRLINKVVIL